MSVVLSPKTILVNLLLREVTNAKQAIILLLQGKIKTTMTPQWMRPDSKPQKSLNYNGEVIIVQAVSKMLLCSVNWDSEVKTNFNPPAITVIWCGNKQW